jgi:nucleoid DNA-binding protein
LNTKNLVNKTTNKSSVNAAISQAIFDRIFELIKDELVYHKGCDIEGFGNFEIEHREMRKEIDYRSKSEVLMPPKDKIKFTPRFTFKKP